MTTRCDKELSKELSKDLDLQVGAEVLVGQHLDDDVDTAAARQGLFV